MGIIKIPTIIRYPSHFKALWVIALPYIYFIFLEKMVRVCAHKKLHDANYIFLFLFLLLIVCNYCRFVGELQ